MVARRATPEMVDLAAPPAGFEAIVSNSSFAWENGPFFEKAGPVPIRGFRVAERHINAGGVCHGGMMMTFADILLAHAVMTVSDPPFVTARLTTDFIDVARLGDWVEGEAECAGETDGLVSVSCKITSSGRLVASASALFKLLRRR